MLRSYSPLGRVLMLIPKWSNKGVITAFPIMKAEREETGTAFFSLAPLTSNPDSDVSEPSSYEQHC